MNFSDFPNTGYWIQTVAYFLSGIGGLGVLYQVRLLRKQINGAEQHRFDSERAADKQLHSSEKHSRCRATIDLVLHEKTDREYLEARRAFAKLKGGNDSLTKYACSKADEHVEEKQAILLVLNQYEFMAAGIFAGAFDEEIYMRMKRSLLIRDWDTLSAFVHELRRQSSNAALFIEFEQLAQSWRQCETPRFDGRRHQSNHGRHGRKPRGGHGQRSQRQR